MIRNRQILKTAILPLMLLFVGQQQLWQGSHASETERSKHVFNAGEKAKIAAQNIIQPDALMGEKSPGFAEAKALFVQAYEAHKGNQFSKALGLYEKASAACPTMYESHYNSGLCYEKLGKLNEAVREFEATATKNHLFPPTFLHLAELYEKLGDPKRANASRAAYGML